MGSYVSLKAHLVLILSRKPAARLQEAEEAAETAQAWAVSLEKNKQRLQAEVADLTIDLEKVRGSSAAYLRVNREPPAGLGRDSHMSGLLRKKFVTQEVVIWSLPTGMHWPWPTA